MRSGRSVSPPSNARSPRRGIGLLALSLMLLGQGAPAARARDVLTVTMDKAKLVKYPAATETVIVGNPIIADVTMLKSSGVLVITGKGYGETNLVLLDRGGTILSEASLRVEPSGALLVVQRGTDRESYACHPRCEPTLSIGDTLPFLKNTNDSIMTRNALAAPAGNGGR